MTGPAPAGAVSLAAVERATAARLGPFYDLRATGGSPDTLVVPGLRSVLAQGGYEDLYVLRRHALQEDDRVAQVVAFDGPTATLQVDRQYLDSVPPAGEAVELHHLHPAELRRAVLLGLRRTWLRDRLLVAEPAPPEPPPDPPPPPIVPDRGPVDLTALAPWLRLPEQVLEVVVADTLVPVPDWEAVQLGARVYLVRPGAPSNLLPGLAVWARRAQADYVNGAYLPDGPTADDDVLAGPLDYLASAGHVEAWRVDRDKLEAASAEQRMPSQSQTAAEFTRVSVATVPWLFQPGGRFGGRGQGRIAPLWGLPGAGGAAAGSPYASSWVNGPSGTAPARRP